MASPSCRLGRPHRFVDVRMYSEEHGDVVTVARSCWWCSELDPNYTPPAPLKSESDGHGHPSNTSGETQ